MVVPLISVSAGTNTPSIKRLCPRSRRDRHAEHSRREPSVRYEPVARSPPTASTDRFSVLVAANPLDGTQSAKHCWQQIADRKVFDVPFATGRQDFRPPQETIALIPAVPVAGSDGGHCTPKRPKIPQTRPAEAEFTVTNVAGTAIAPIFMILRRVRCVPESDFPNSTAIIFPPHVSAVPIRYIALSTLSLEFYTSG